MAAKEMAIAAKVQTLGVGTRGYTKPVGIVAAIRIAIRRWSDRGPLGGSYTKELDRRTGARC